MTVLHGITWQHARGFAPLAATASYYQALHPGVHVHWEQAEWYAFEAKVVEAVRTSGCYNLVMLDHPWTGTFAANRWLVPFDDLLRPDEMICIRKSAVAPSYESYVWDGKLWALPVDAACHMLTYRAGLLAVEDTPIPSTWEDVIAVAAQLHDPPGFYALALPFAGVQAFMLFLTVAATHGFEPYQYPAQAVLPPTESEQVLGIMQSLARFCHPGSFEWGPVEVLEHLASCSDTWMSPSIFGYVNHAHALEYGAVPGTFPHSMGRPILGGVGLAISAASRHIGAALDYARFVISGSAQTEIFPANEGQPGLTEAWQSPSLPKATQKFYHVMLDGMRSAYTRPRFPGWMEIELESGPALLALSGVV